MLWKGQIYSNVAGMLLLSPVSTQALETNQSHPLNEYLSSSCIRTNLSTR